MNNVFLSLTIAILFGIGTFLILRRDIIRVIIGLTIISHAINMMIVSAGIFNGSKVPIITGDEHTSASSGTVFNDSISQGILAPITSSGQIEFHAGSFREGKVPRGLRSGDGQGMVKRFTVLIERASGPG